jgi:uncharacterized protein (TIGR02246 family)
MMGRPGPVGTKLTMGGMIMRRLNCIAASTLLGLCAMPALAAEASAADCWLKAFRASDAEAVSQCYAADAVLYIPGGPTATGRDAIREGYAGFFAGVTVKSAEITPTNTVKVGSDAVAWGSFHVVYTDKKTGAETTEDGRYTDLSRKIDGHWLYIGDHASDNPSVAETPAAQ